MNVKILSNIEDKIKNILTENIEARKNDNLLMSLYIKNFLVDYANYNILDFLKLNIVSFESITRARRKCQEKYPELRDMDMYYKRDLQQLSYIEYANIKGG